MNKKNLLLGVLFFTSYVGCKKDSSSIINENNTLQTDMKQEISGDMVEIKVLEETKKFTLSKLRERRKSRRNREASFEQEDSFVQVEEEILGMIDSIYSTNDTQSIQNMENYLEENGGIDVNIQQNIYVTEGAINNDEIEYIRTENELNSLINNSFEGDDVVEIENSIEELNNMGETNQNSRSRDIKLKYHKYDIKQRGMSSDKITPASLLAYYFANTEDFIELENLKNMFGKNIDISKVREKTQKMRKIAGRDQNLNTRSKGGGMYPTELVYKMNEDPGKFLDDGDIILCNSEDSKNNFFIGYWTHSGIFSEDKWIKDMSQKEEAYTVLTANSNNGPEQSDRRNQACYDRISVYNNSKAMRVQWPLGWNRNLGRIAVNTARENFYDPRAGFDIPNRDFFLWFLFNESHKMNGRFAYCSRVVWYGWKRAGKEIECDYDARTRGNIITPNNLEKGAYNIKETSCWWFFGWRCSTKTTSTQKTTTGINKRR